MAKKHRLEEEFWILLGQDNIFLDQDSNCFSLSISVVLICRASFCKQRGNMTCDHVLGIID